MNVYKAIIFDLGNVVFKCSFDKAFQYWANSLNIDINYIKTNFKFDNFHELFEKDLINIYEFETHISEMLNIKFNDNIFINGWNSIYLEIIPGVDNLLKYLKNKYRLIALTNTNSIHFPIWTNKYQNQLLLFEKIFSSHLMKTRKPEKKAYEFILKNLNLSPSEVLFLDDNNENVQAALNMGIKSILVTSFDKMINDLKLLGISVS